MNFVIIFAFRSIFKNRPLFFCILILTQAVSGSDHQLSIQCRSWFKFKTLYNLCNYAIMQLFTARTCWLTSFPQANFTTQHFLARNFQKVFTASLHAVKYDKYQNAKESFRIDVSTLASCALYQICLPLCPVRAAWSLIMSELKISLRTDRSKGRTRNQRWEHSLQLSHQNRF